MRFPLAVLAGGVAAAPAFFRLPEWIGATAYLALFYLAAVGLGAGFFAARRGALAGALAVYAGLLLWTVAGYVRQGGAAFGPFAAAQGVLSLGLVIAPYAVAAAASGAFGGWLRGRAAARWG
ncbi:hypothetical protein BH18CHL2_BH18CHL2_04080 [soil metagenome]